MSVVTEQKRSDTYCTSFVSLGPMSLLALAVMAASGIDFRLDLQFGLTATP